MTDTGFKPLSEDLLVQTSVVSLAITCLINLSLVLNT